MFWMLEAFVKMESNLSFLSGNFWDAIDLEEKSFLYNGTELKDTFLESVFNHSVHKLHKELWVTFYLSREI